MCSLKPPEWGVFTLNPSPGVFKMEWDLPLAYRHKTPIGLKGVGVKSILFSRRAIHRALQIYTREYFKVLY